MSTSTRSPAGRVSAYCKSQESAIFSRPFRLRELKTPSSSARMRSGCSPVGQMVHQEDGVTIRSWAAMQADDRPVSFSLARSPLEIVIGGGTCPNKWYIYGYPGRRRISIAAATFSLLPE